MLEQTEAAEQQLIKLKNGLFDTLEQFGHEIKALIPDFDELVRSDAKLGARLFVIKRMDDQLKETVELYFEELEAKRNKIAKSNEIIQQIQMVLEQLSF